MFIRTTGNRARIGAGLFLLGACLSLFTAAGCSRKERVVDVQTPAGNVTVDKDKSNGNVEVNVDKK